jgi:acetyltransferase-like isoleucine patch superfamily enzyme
LRDRLRKLFLAYVYFANALAASLPDGRTMFKLRAAIFRSSGNDIARGVRIKSGTKIWGTGLSLADGVIINRNCYFDMSGAITIDENCNVGHGVTFITSAHDMGPPERRCGTLIAKPIRVGSGSWIGSNATIMPGVVIGRGCVVGAGAVVSRNIPDDALVLLRPPQVASAAALRFVARAE